MKFRKNDQVNLNVKFGAKTLAVNGIVKKVDGNHAELTVDCGNVEYTFGFCDIVESVLKSD